MPENDIISSINTFIAYPLAAAAATATFKVLVILLKKRELKLQEKLKEKELYVQKQLKKDELLLKAQTYYMQVSALAIGLSSELSTKSKVGGISATPIGGPISQSATNTRNAENPKIKPFFRLLTFLKRRLIGLPFPKILIDLVSPFFLNTQRT